LLLHLLAVLSPSGEVVIGIDDTIERRWGGKMGWFIFGHFGVTDGRAEAAGR
jgi:hypothetical protein